MALIKCRECGKEISTKADACPHCGAKRTGTASSIVSGIRIVWYLFLAAILFVFLRACYQTADTLSRTPSSTGISSQADALASAEITQWNWVKDRSFGTRGAIKWNVSVLNKSDKYIQHVKVELTTFDKDRKLVSTTSTYVSAIPPGQTRSDNSFADLYGTEHTAATVISSVSFAR